MIHVPEHTKLLPNSFRIMISVGYERQSGGEWKTEDGQKERRIRNPEPPPQHCPKDHRHWSKCSRQVDGARVVQAGNGLGSFQSN